MLVRASSILLTFAVAGVAMPAAAQSFAQGNAETRISEPAGIAIVQDIIANTNSALALIGTGGGAVSLAVPSSVNLSNAGGDSLAFGTVAQVSANSSFLSQDSVSVSVGAI